MAQGEGPPLTSTPKESKPAHTGSRECSLDEGTALLLPVLQTSQPAPRGGLTSHSSAYFPEPYGTPGSCQTGGSLSPSAHCLHGFGLGILYGKLGWCLFTCGIVTGAMLWESLTLHMNCI